MSQSMSAADILAGQNRALEGVELSSCVATSIDMGQGVFGVLSYYPDPEWRLAHTRFPKSTPESNRKLKYQKIPECFQPQMRQIMLHYLVKGIEGRKSPAGSTLVDFFNKAAAFLRYMASQFKFASLQAIKPMHCIQYVEYQKSRISQKTGKPLGVSALTTLFGAVETLQLLSLRTDDKMVSLWPENSASHLAGNTGGLGVGKGKTKIIPDDILDPLFVSCVDAINNADHLLGLRAGVEALRSGSRFHIKVNKYLSDQGWVGGHSKFNIELEFLLTACMIVIFTTTGIRVHELAHICAGQYHAKTNKTGGYYSTIIKGERYYWLRTRSDKTGEGLTEYLSTELTHDAIKVAERISAPIREQLGNDIALLQAEHPNDPRIIEKRQHLQAVFLGKSSTKGNDITTLSDLAIRDRLIKYVKSQGLDWAIATHQFRRTFAVYVARSVHGDLRYLREHFKHWGLDMTATYALNTQQEADLYNEIIVAMNDERNATVMSWFEEDAIITGGGSEGIKVFRAKNEAVKTFEGRKAMVNSISETIHIRGTGTAWCTADDGGCGGGTAADKTRCGKDCSNAVIDRSFQRKWELIYAQQIELTEIDDIGNAGQERVQRDLARCESVLTGLGVDLESIKREGIV